MVRAVCELLKESNVCMNDRLQMWAGEHVRFAWARVPRLQATPPKDRLTVQLNLPDLSNGPCDAASCAQESKRKQPPV